MTEPLQSPENEENVLSWTKDQQIKAVLNAPVVHCPCCNHGIDPHGSDPGWICGVGGCTCLLTPGAIYEALRPDVASVMAILNPDTVVELYVSHEGLQSLQELLKNPRVVLEGDFGPRANFFLYPDPEETA